MSYVLKAEYKGETLYYMNVIMVTEQIDCAETYETKEQAEKDLQHFRNLFFYGEPKIEIVELVTV